MRMPRPRFEHCPTGPSAADSSRSTKRVRKPRRAMAERVRNRAAPSDGGSGGAVSAMFGQIDRVLGRIEQLSSRLRADPELFVHRSALELRAAFDERRAIEP